jgi:hypothetical protein
MRSTGNVPFLRPAPAFLLTATDSHATRASHVHQHACIHLHPGGLPAGAHVQLQNDGGVADEANAASTVFYPGAGRSVHVGMQLDL